MRDFALFGTLQFVSILNVVVNFRAIAHQRYAAAVATDGLAAVLAYVTIRLVANNHSTAAAAGLALGSMVASYVGIRLTRTWK